MYRGGGGPESGRKKFEKCLPAGTGTKIYFSPDKDVSSPADTRNPLTMPKNSCCNCKGSSLHNEGQGCAGQLQSSTYLPASH